MKKKPAKKLAKLAKIVEHKIQQFVMKGIFLVKIFWRVHNLFVKKNHANFQSFKWSLPHAQHISHLND